MLFDARGLYLVQLAESEDIVANDIFFAVVLVKAAGLGVIDEIVLHDDIAAALVGVKAPAAVAVGIDIVKDVVADNGAFGRAECINAAHVTEYAPSDMMHVVEAENVAFGQAVRIAPSPADR